MKELSNALDAVVDWRTLGIKLGLEAAEVRRIEKVYPHDNAECKSEMLACCLRTDHPPNWKKVVDALCWMGEHRSAYKIRKKHLKSMKGTPFLVSYMYVCCDILLCVVSTYSLNTVTRGVPLTI